MTVEDELKLLARDNSHPKFPLLRVDYSPSSRYPATDFTSWISARIAQRDSFALGILMTQLTAGNPGMGVGQDYWKSTAAKLAALDMQQSIHCEDLKAYADLHSALFPYVLHGPLNGFMLVSYHIEYLCRVMSPFKFSIPNLTGKAKAANEFIQEMREKSAGLSAVWSEFPNINTEKIDRLLQSQPPSSALRSILRELSIGARLMFLGTVEEGTGQGAWKVRPFGVDEKSHMIELLRANLGIFVDDEETILSTYRNEELLSALAGYPAKRGWKKKYIIKFMRQNAPDIVAKLREGRQAFAAKKEWSSTARELIQWTNSLRTPLAVALAFN